MHCPTTESYARHPSVQGDRNTRRWNQGDRQDRTGFQRVIRPHIAGKREYENEPHNRTRGRRGLRRRLFDVRVDRVRDPLPPS